MRFTILLCSMLASFASSFMAPSSLPPCAARRAATFLKDGESNLETIEFRIYPDGRVEEVVRGVKGANCQKVTESINAALGKVVESAPTEEMYETAVTVENEVRITDSDWEGSSSW